MKAQFVFENIADFQRGINPKKSMNIGKEKIRKDILGQHYDYYTNREIHLLSERTKIPESSETIRWNVFNSGGNYEANNNSGKVGGTIAHAELVHSLWEDDTIQGFYEAQKKALEVLQYDYEEDSYVTPSGNKYLVLKIKD